MKREIEMVIAVRKRQDVDEAAERAAYWATRSPSERLDEVESLRAMALKSGIEIGNVERVASVRRRGAPPVERPAPSITT